VSAPVGDPRLPPPDPRAPLLRALFDALPDPVRLADPRGRILFDNRRARELFTLDSGADEAIRRRVEANDFRFTSLLARGEAPPGEPRELVLHDPVSGAERVFEAALAPLDGDASLPAATVALLRDVTAPSARLARQGAELERAYRHRSAFLASMSHELRTPINVITGYAALLRERIYGPLSERQDDALARMEGATAHLLELVNDVLDVAKIEAGRMPLHLCPVALDELVRQVAESMEPLARSSGLALSVDVPPDLPPLVSDPARLRQILLNLLSNAVKFTRSGGVSLVARRAGDDAVEIVVSDTGIGIPPDELDRIFDDFRQVDQSSTREYEGTGLGLSIVRKLLGLLGGSIRVRSVPGEGSTFTITVPLRSREVPEGEEAVRRALGGEVVVVRDGAAVRLPAEDAPGGAG
jgi:signal transduction histidine kinase